MPFIRTTTNVGLTKDAEIALKQRMAGIVQDILGKDPARMLTAFEGDIHLYRGLDDTGDIPAAFVECKFFGGKDHASFERFDAAMKQIYGEVLHIEPVNLYIKYEVINGWNEPAHIFKV